MHVMKNEILKQLRFWFFSDLELEEIGRILLQKNIITDFRYDYENVYEWIEAQTDNANIDFNIARKHNDWENFSAEPITVLIMYSGLEPSNNIVEKKAKLFAEKLQLPISLGTVDYLGDDNFEYNEQKRINA